MFFVSSKILYIWEEKKKKHNFWLAKPNGIANQELCYFQMLLNAEKPEEQN